jgi:chromosome segregation ATPase
MQRAKGSKFSFKSILQYIITGVLATQCLRSFREVQRVTQELNQLQEDYEYTHRNLVHLEEELDSAHEDFHQLQMKVLAGQSGDYYHHSEIGEEERKEVAMGIIQKHDHQANRIDQLQKSIQKNYEMELERRYVFSLQSSLFVCVNLCVVQGILLSQFVLPQIRPWSILY